MSKYLCGNIFINLSQHFNNVKNIQVKIKIKEIYNKEVKDDCVEDLNIISSYGLKKSTTTYGIIPFEGDLDTECTEPPQKSSA